MSPSARFPRSQEKTGTMWQNILKQSFKMHSLPICKSDYMFSAEKAPVFRNQSSQTSHLFHPFGGKRNPIRRLKHIESYVDTEQ